MSWTRITTYFGALLLVAFVVLYFLATPKTGGENPFATLILVVVAVVLLIAAGSRLYGRNSRYGAIAASKRPAQEAHNRAADLAADARRATAEAAKNGERYCPLDPANTDDHPGTNGHAPTTHPAPPQPQ